MNLAENVCGQMTVNKTAWKLETAFVDRTTLTTARALAAYTANSNPETKNHETASAKTATFRDLRVCMSEAGGVLRANPLVSDGELVGWDSARACATLTNRFPFPGRPRS
ncbi:MAG: hypothetical protein LBI96_01500 [Odoribacteraceae bacterium]|jgi:hypothetical protein|nr:hypothetical protein [Odoribacteraceae bacterium]